MATIKQGILGGFSGRVGGVIGSSWKGLKVMKSAPVSVANPKTAPQVAQRTNFSDAVGLAQSILSTFIKPLWDRFASQMSGYNAFVSANIEYFSNGSITQYGDLKMSIGKMASTAIATCTRNSAQDKVTVTWANDSGQGFKLASDKAYVAVIQDGLLVGEAFATNAIRSAGTVQVTLKDNFESDSTLHVYLAFLRADGTIVSDNSYILSDQD